MFLLLDVSSNADQMGVSLGNAIQVERDHLGGARLRTVGEELTGTPSGNDLQLQILNMDVVVSAQNLRAVTLPQISWEPILNIPLAIEGSPDNKIDLVSKLNHIGVAVFQLQGEGCLGISREIAERRIQFPSPEELTLDPTPPLKLEAGLRVGFYFNEVLSIPTDLTQLRWCASPRRPPQKNVTGLSSTLANTFLSDTDPGVRKWGLQTLEVAAPQGIRPSVEKIMKDDPDPALRDLARRIIDRIK
jgi:hypothetical protein